jgi:hypothetical protein
VTVAAGWNFGEEFSRELRQAVDERTRRADENEWTESAIAVAGSLAWWMESLEVSKPTPP